MLKYSKDGKVVFDPQFHTYHLGDKKLKSVTKYISEFKPVFDTIPIATSFAEKHGLKVEDVIRDWKIKGENSMKSGTAVHKVIEDYITDGVMQVSGVYPKENIAIKIINELFKTGRLTPVDAEVIVYNDSLGGQIDCIARNSDGKHFILDWKTNEKIEKESFRGKTMFPPYDNLFDCNYYHYSLQTAIYKKLYKEYEIDSCYIVHVTDDNYHLIKTIDIDLNL